MSIQFIEISLYKRKCEQPSLSVNVHFKSCHPPHTKINIPFNLARSYCTIIEKETSKEQHLLNLKSTLLKLDYPRNLIEHSIQQAKKIPLEELRSPKEQHTEKQPLAFVTTFNPRNFDIFKVIKEAISMLDASPKMKRAMSNFNLINSNRQPANIKQVLSRAKLFKSSSRDTSKLK